MSSSLVAFVFAVVITFLPLVHPIEYPGYQTSSPTQAGCVSTASTPKTIDANRYWLRSTNTQPTRSGIHVYCNSSNTAQSCGKSTYIVCAWTITTTNLLPYVMFNWSSMMLSGRVFVRLSTNTLPGQVVETTVSTSSTMSALLPTPIVMSSKDFASTTVDPVINVTIGFITTSSPTFLDFAVEWTLGNVCSGDAGGGVPLCNTSTGLSNVECICDCRGMSYTRTCAPDENYASLRSLFGEESGITPPVCTWKPMCTHRPFGLPTVTRLEGSGVIASFKEDFALLSNRGYEVISFKNSRGITGTIPESMSQLTRLNTFVLSDTAISGTIPPDFLALPLLAVLVLKSNRMTGAMNLRLPNLLLLDFSSNTFEDVSGLQNSPNLVELDGSSNHLTGSLPEVNSTAITRIALNSNSFSGKIPESYFKAVNLAELDLSENDADGPISPFFILPKIKKLYFTNNYFQEDMMKSIHGFISRKLPPSTVEELFLDRNVLYGPIVSLDIPFFAKVTQFKLSFNSWSCPKPECIAPWIDCAQTSCYNFTLSAQTLNPATFAVLSDSRANETVPLRLLVKIMSNPPPGPEGFELKFEEKHVADVQWVGEAIADPKKKGGILVLPLTSNVLIDCCSQHCTMLNFVNESTMQVVDVYMKLGGIVNNELMLTLRHGEEMVEVSESTFLPTANVHVIFTITSIYPMHLTVADTFFYLIGNEMRNFTGIRVRCILTPDNAIPVYFQLEYVNSTHMKCVFAGIGALPTTPPKTFLSIVSNPNTQGVLYTAVPWETPYPIWGPEAQIVPTIGTNVFSSSSNVPTPSITVDFHDSLDNELKFLRSPRTITVTTTEPRMNHTFPTGTYVANGTFKLPPIVFRYPLARVYVFEFSTSGTVIPKASLSFVITPGVPHHLDFEVRPAYKEISTPLDPQPNVKLLDEANNRLTASTYPKASSLFLQAVLLSEPKDAEQRILSNPASLRDTFLFEGMLIETRFGFQYWIEFTILGNDAKYPVSPLRTTMIETPKCSEDTQYGVFYTQICRPCPTGLNCSGTPFTNVLPGYWRPNQFTGSPIQCPYQPVCGGSSVQTNPSSFKFNESDVECLEGSLGIVCGACDQSYGKVFNGCRKCPSPAFSFIFLLLLILVVVIVSCLLVATNLPSGTGTGEKSRFSVVLKMFISHLQVTALIRGIDVEWTQWISDFFFSLEWLSSIDTNLFEVRCAMYVQMDQYNMFFIFALTPFFVAVVSLVVSRILYKLRSRHEDYEHEWNEDEDVKIPKDAIPLLRYNIGDSMPDCNYCGADYAVIACEQCEAAKDIAQHFLCDKCDAFVHHSKKYQHHIRVPVRYKQTAEYMIYHATQMFISGRTTLIVTGIVLLFFMYTSMMKEIASLLKCEGYLQTVIDTKKHKMEEVTRRYLSRDPLLDCDTETHKSWWYISLIVFTLYGLGIPLVGAYFLIKNRKKIAKKTFLAKFGFMYSGFRKKYFYWEMVILIRKSAVILIVSIFSEVTTQLYALMWLLGSFFALNMYLRPLKFYHSLEALSLGSQTITLNLFLLMRPLLNGHDVFSILSMFLIFVLNIGVVFAFAYFLFVEVKREIAFKTKGNPNAAVAWVDIVRRSSLWLRSYFVHTKEDAKEQQPKDVETSISNFFTPSMTWASYMGATNPDGPNAIERELKKLLGLVKDVEEERAVEEGQEMHELKDDSPSAEVEEDCYDRDHDEYYDDHPDWMMDHDPHQLDVPHDAEDDAERQEMMLLYHNTVKGQSTSTPSEAEEAFKASPGQPQPTMPNATVLKSDSIPSPQPVPVPLPTVRNRKPPLVLPSSVSRQMLDKL